MGGSHSIHQIALGEVGTKGISTAAGLRKAMKEYVPTDSEFKGAFATARVSRAHLARYGSEVNQRVISRLAELEPND